MKNIIVLMAGMLALCSTFSNANNQLSVDQINTIREPNQKFADSLWWKHFPGSSRSKNFIRSAGYSFIDIWAPPPPCPTALWAFKTFKTSRIAEWNAHIKGGMDDFPETSIEYCQQLTYVSKRGVITHHPDALSANLRWSSTVIIKDRSSDKITSLPAIFETDIHSLQTGGSIYNQFLIPVCNYTLIDVIESESAKATLKCGKIGTFNALMELKKPSSVSGKSLKHSEVIMVGENSDASILISNLSLDKAKKRYPKVFETQK